MKKLIAAAALVVALAVPSVASAENQASPCGANHGAFANVNGNFGFLGGLHGTPYFENWNKTEPGTFAVGQDPGATGYNNSHTTAKAFFAAKPDGRNTYGKVPASLAG
jgi:hypothetical protein